LNKLALLAGIAEINVCENGESIKEILLNAQVMHFNAALNISGGH